MANWKTFFQKWQIWQSRKAVMQQKCVANFTYSELIYDQTNWPTIWCEDQCNKLMQMYQWNAFLNLIWYAWPVKLHWFPLKLYICSASTEQIRVLCLFWALQCGSSVNSRLTEFYRNTSESHISSGFCSWFWHGLLSYYTSWHPLSLYVLACTEDTTVTKIQPWA